MALKKKTRPYLRYKKFLKLKQNVQNKSKIINFKSKKWQSMVLKEKRNFRFSYKIKHIDQFNYFVPKFTDFFSNKFKLDLYAKQKFVYLYGYLTKKSLKSYINKGMTKDKINYWLLKQLESRLDSVLYRSHFVDSFRTARQLISHGHILVNNTVVKKHSFNLTEGDVISVSKKTHILIEKKILKSNFLPLTPKYLQVNYKIFFISFLGNLTTNNLTNQFTFWLNSKTVVDFYKHN